MADAGSPATTPQRSQECSPPGPKGLPVIGHLLEIRRDPLGFFSTCSERYGNIVSLRFGTWPALLLSGPSDVEIVPSSVARAIGRAISIDHSATQGWYLGKACRAQTRSAWPSIKGRCMDRPKSLIRILL